MDIPWKSLAPVEPGREYVVLLSYLPLRRYSKMPLFFRYSGQINRQLRATPGAIGYTMRAKLLSRRFWTLSVWDNDKALMEFVAKVPHGEAMKQIAPYMDKTNFWRWKLPSAEIPPRWDDAMRRAAASA
ncbi:MAG TPA: hypothetical protein VGJ06_19410 [Candidatus Acidoferrum sp.]|jgi:hypothetical protein